MTGQHFVIFDSAIGPCGIVWGERGISGVQMPMGSEEKTRIRIRQGRGELSEAPPPAEVQDAISGDQEAFVYTHEEYKQWISRIVDQYFALTYLQMVIAIFVAAIGLINTMVISVAERHRELGIFRAIGGLRRHCVE